MKKEIKFITELLSIAENKEENLKGNFEVELNKMTTKLSEFDLINLSKKEFKILSVENSNTLENYISYIFKIKNNSVVEFNKFTLTSYLKSIE